MFDKELREFRAIAEKGIEAANRNLQAQNTTNKLLVAILEELKAQRSKENPKP